MSPKGFGLLLVVCGICVGLAVKALGEREAPMASSLLDEPAFPGLAGDLEAVSAVRVETGGGTVTARRGEAGWSLAERDGFPADGGKARDVVLAMANLRLMEPKTALASKLPLLELEDPAGEEAASRRVTLMDAEGAPLASLVIGKERFGAFGPGRNGAYVRLDGETQSWLADRTLRLPSAATDWLARDLLSIPADDIDRVELGSDGEIVLMRDETGAIILENMPEGRVLAQAFVDPIIGTLSSLKLEDVRKAESDEIARIPARFVTRDGLEVLLELSTETDVGETRHWVRFTFEGSADSASTSRAELDGWEAQIPGHVAERLGSVLEDLLEPRGDGTG